MPKVPTAQEGAIVKKPSIIGVAEKEPEAIIPLSRMPTININVTIGSVNHPADENRLAKKISKEIAKEYHRLSGGVL
jgi:hypothetical protein